MRNLIFQSKEYYHIYNRGVDKRDVFMNEKDYIKFIYKIRDHNDIVNISDKFKIDQSAGHLMSADIKC